MIVRFETWFRRLRRRFSRSRWLIRLLGLSVSPEPRTHPGLIMIQIDGLSRREVDRALAKGELPFLKRLIEREHYHLHDFYSGLPSTTPGVQGEILYGVPTAVPAFSFKHRESGEIFKMYYPASAERIEKILETTGDVALLEGGSAYSDIYTGGAAETHFSPAEAGWEYKMGYAHPLVMIFFVLTHLDIVIRIMGLMVIELFLALVDMVRGLQKGFDVFKEIAFVPTRVAICIMLRELILTGVCMDIARGLPVIHLNLLGYDEQAHRRGPDSLYAHWTLKGIDDTIERIWKAAHDATNRAYDLWVYADHGQEATVPYEKIQGWPLRESVAAVSREEKAAAEGGDEATIAEAGAGSGYRSFVPSPSRQRKRYSRDSVQFHRVRFLGGKAIHWLASLFAEEGPETPGEDECEVAAMGPVAHLYFKEPRDAESTASFARRLTNSAAIPLVLAVEDGKHLKAWTSDGEFQLPQQTAEILGPDHPFLEELTRDVQALCRHPDAGDLVLCGWRHGIEKAVTFAIENGSHCGLGPVETRAFALMPGDTSLPEGVDEKGYLRPLDLRLAALHFMGRSTKTTSAAKVLGRRRVSRTFSPPEEVTLRVMTYNVHGCRGMDGKVSTERIARVIARENPDVVALQELDVGRTRSEGMDQAELIARHLEMDFHFHPAMQIEEELYGDAILTHLPMQLIKTGTLPGLPDRPGLEPRGAIWVAVNVHGVEVHILNTHLGLSARERVAQVEALLSEEWLGHPDCQAPAVLCGDFNALPNSLVCQRLTSRLRDSQLQLKGHQPHGTFFARFPKARIDHVFIDEAARVSSIHIPISRLARLSSDHLPLTVELTVSRNGSEPS